MKIECTQKQAGIIQRALEIYGRMRMLQFDIVMWDFSINPPSGTDSHLRCLEHEDVAEIDRLANRAVRNVFGHTLPRDIDGSIAFCMSRNLHKHGHDKTRKPDESCCTCDGNFLTCGEPPLKIED